MGPPKQFKIVVVGDPRVGKTCLLTLFTHGTCKRHLDNYVATTGVDFSPKTFEIDGQSYNFTFCDVAGTSRKRSTPKPPPYYKGAHGVIIVYDVTDEKSFDNVSNLWLKDVSSHTDQGKIQKVLIANKCDTTRVIVRAKGLDLSEDEGIPYFETSASTGSNVEEAFMSIAKAIRLKFDPKEGLPPLRLAMSRTMSSSSRTPSSRFMTSRIRPQGRLNSSHYTKYVSIGSSEISSSLEARSFHKMPTDVSTSLHSNDTVLGLLKSDKKARRSSDSSEQPKSKSCLIL